MGCTCCRTRAKQSQSSHRLQSRSPVVIKSSSNVQKHGEDEAFMLSVDGGKRASPDAVGKQSSLENPRVSQHSTGSGQGMVHVVSGRILLTDKEDKEAKVPELSRMRSPKITDGADGKKRVDLTMCHTTTLGSIASNESTMSMDLTGHSDALFRASRKSRRSRADTTFSTQTVTSTLPLVMDIGSHTSKIGFVGKEAPSHIFPTAAASSTGASGSDMECMWERAFSELDVEPSRCPLLLTEASTTTRASRERNVQILFETFDVPEVYFENPAVLSLFSSGRRTGLAVDLGETASDVVPVYDGKRMTASMNRLNVSGYDLSKYMAQLLYGNHALHKISDAQLHQIGQQAKEDHAHAAMHFPTACDTGIDPSEGTTSQKLYALPDGQVLLLGEEPFKCAEALFQPALVGRHGAPGLAKLVFDTVLRCDADLRRSLFSGIVLAGGTGLLSGLHERLVRDLGQFTSEPLLLAVQASMHRQNAAWHGGAILGAMNSFHRLCFTQEDYEENGPAGVHFYCF